MSAIAMLLSTMDKTPSKNITSEYRQKNIIYFTHFLLNANILIFNGFPENKERKAVILNLEKTNDNPCF